MTSLQPPLPAQSKTRPNSNGAAYSAPADLCRTGTLVMQNRRTGDLVIVPTLCHKWSCPYCANERFLRVRALARAGKPERLITLTLRPAPGVGLRCQISNLRLCWRRLLQRLRRQFGPFEWLSALELTKNGTPHMHVLQRGAYIPQAWLSQAWKAYTGAYIVHIRKVDQVPGSVAEVTKYLAKTAAALELSAPHVPVFTHSRGWLPDDYGDQSDPQDPWDFKIWLPVSWHELQGYCEDFGIALEPLREGSRAHAFRFLEPPDQSRLRQMMEIGTTMELMLGILISDEWTRQKGRPVDFADTRAAMDYAKAPDAGVIDRRTL